MKGKIVIECIQKDVVDAVAEAEGWDLEKGEATGLSINIGMAATRSEVVEVCYSLCTAFKLDPMEKMMLALKLAGAMPGESRRDCRVAGPWDGQPAEPGGDAPPLL